MHAAPRVVTKAPFGVRNCWSRVLKLSPTPPAPILPRGAAPDFPPDPGAVLRLPDPPSVAGARVRDSISMRPTRLFAVPSSISARICAKLGVG